MKSVKKKSIKTQITRIMLISSISLLLIMQFYKIGTNYFQNRHTLRETKKIMYNAYDRNIRNQVENIHSLISSVYKYQQENNLSYSEGKNLARELIRNIRYEKEGYFWIDDYEGTNILYPAKPEEEGKNRYNLKDKKGTFFAKEVIAQGRKGGGFTDYWFPKPGENKASPKRSYSLAFTPYRWVIGTGNYIDDIETALDKQRQVYNERFRSSIYISVLIFIGAVILALVLAMLLARSLANPVKAVAVFANKVSKGHLAEKIEPEYTKRNDEIGTMVSSIQMLEDNLNDIVSEIDGITMQLSTTSEESSASSMAFAKNAQQQAASVEEINATIEQVTAGVDSINMNTKTQLTSVNSLSKSVSLLKEIEEKIKEIINSIVFLSQNISNQAVEGNKALALMNDRFKEISEGSSNMLNMVAIITGIADQINLLSLNAAIESARAGEAGRGFAVVADEISKLADETAKNVKMIQNNIAQSDEKIKQGEVIVTDSLEKLQVVIKGVQEIDTAIKSVENEIQRQATISNNVNTDSTLVKEKSEEIQISISEQKIAMDEITSSVTLINQSVQANASGAEEIAGSSEQIASMSQVLKEKLNYFKLH